MRVINKFWSRPRSGVAMFMVLAVVVTVTMLGFMGLSLARSDSGSAGAMLDRMSRETAARSGLAMTVSAIESEKDSAMKYLQHYIEDSSLTTGYRQWFVFAKDGAPFRLQATDPGFFLLGDESQQTAAKVRVVSMDLGTVSGPPEDGIKITLEATGRGRRGDLQTIVATYRIQGADLPMEYDTGSVAYPGFTFYMNGAISNGNMGNGIDGSVFVSGSLTENSGAPIRVKGRMIVGGNLTSNDSIDVDSNAIVKGRLYIQNKGARFRKSFVVGEIQDNTQKNLVVDESFVYRSSGGGNKFSNGAIVSVGKDFVALNANPFLVDNSRILVGNNSWIRRLSFSNGSNFVFGQDGSGNLELTGVGALGSSSIPKGSTVNGYLAARYTTSALGFSSNGGTGSLTRIAGGLYSNAAVSVSTPDFQVGGMFASMGGLASVGNTSFSVGSDMWLRGNPQSTFSIKPVIAGNLVINGSVVSGFNNWKLTGSNRFFRYNTYGNPSGVGVLGGTLVPKTTDSTFVTDEHVTGTSYPAPPRLVQDLGYSARDTMADTTNLPPDSVKVDAINSPIVNAGVVELTDAMANSAGVSDLQNWSANDFNLVFDYFKKQGWLVNGYMVVRLTGACSFKNIKSDGQFNGKALWIVEKFITVSGRWPSSASSANLQMIYVRKNGSFDQFGFTGNFWGYIHFEATTTANIMFTNATLYGALGIRGINSQWNPNSGKLTIIGNQDVFDDFAKNLPGVYRGTNVSSDGTSFTNGIVRRLTSRWSQVKLIRIGEYR